MGTLLEARVPDLGDYKDVEVIDLAVRVGDAVALDATLVTLETEKATMDVPSTVAGIVREVLVGPGSRVSQGDLIARVEVEAATQAAPLAAAAAPATGSPAAAPQAASAPTPAPAVATAPAPAQPTLPSPGTGSIGGGCSNASPSIRRFARELGVDLGQVRGSGRKGRITEQDVKAHVKRLLTAPGILEVDSIIMALGTNANPLLPQSTPELKLNKWGYILADEETCQTSMKGVYAGGDIVTGSATVILAMGAGRKAAKAIDRYLGGTV